MVKAGPKARKNTGLEQRLEAARSKMSPTRQELMRRIMADPDGTFFLSARQLGKKLSVDAATIVRMAQAIGYEGYSEFNEALRAHFVASITPYSVARSTSATGQTMSHILAQSLEKDLTNLSRVQAALDPDHMEAVARALLSANKVLVVGFDLAHSAAFWLAYSLSMIGVDAEAPVERALAGYKSHRLEKGDILVAITFRRCMKSTVEAATVAHDRGAGVIAITDSETNAIATRADYVLQSSIEHPVVSASQAALMGLLNAIVVTCTQLDKARALDALSFTDAEYDEGGRWWK